MQMTKTTKTAVSGVIAALCVAMMFFGGLIPLFTYIMPVFCGLVIYIAHASFGWKYAVAVYAATAAASFMVCNDKECALLFAAFFGYYPVLKYSLERLGKPVLAWLAKFAVFNAAMIAAQWLLVLLFGLEGFYSSALGAYLIPILLVLANILFLCYDRTLVQVARLYHLKWKHYLNRLLK